MQRTLGEQRSLASLVLGDLVHSVLLALLRLAVCLLGLGNVHLSGRASLLRLGDRRRETKAGSQARLRHDEQGEIPGAS